MKPQAGFESKRLAWNTTSNIVEVHQKQSQQRVKQNARASSILARGLRAGVRKVSHAVFSTVTKVTQCYNKNVK